MKKYTAYLKNTGEFVLYTELSEESLSKSEEANPDIGWVEGHHESNTHYFVNGVVTAKPSMGISVNTLANSINTPFTFSNVPDNTHILFLTEDYFSDGTDIEWASAVPGTFNIGFYKFPYLKQVFTLEVTDT